MCCPQSTPKIRTFVNTNMSYPIGVVSDLNWRFQRDYLTLANNILMIPMAKYMNQTYGSDEMKQALVECQEIVIQTAVPHEFITRVLEMHDGILLKMYFSGKKVDDIIYNSNVGFSTLKREFHALHQYMRYLYMRADKIVNPHFVNGENIPRVLMETSKLIREQTNAMNLRHKKAKYQLISSFFHGTQYKSGSSQLWKIGSRYSQEGIRRSIAEYVM